MSSEFRVENDPLGPLQVPSTALYGVQTLRAMQNFPISGLRPLPAFVDAVVWIKRSAALTHKETGRLDATLADAIVKAADEVLGGQHRGKRLLLHTKSRRMDAIPSHDLVLSPYAVRSGYSIRRV